MNLEYKEELEKILPLLQCEDNESKELGKGLFKESKFYLDLLNYSINNLYIFDYPDDNETNLKDFLEYCLFSHNTPYTYQELGSWIEDLLKGTSKIIHKKVITSTLTDFSINGN